MSGHRGRDVGQHLEVPTLRGRTAFAISGLLLLASVASGGSAVRRESNERREPVERREADRRRPTGLRGEYFARTMSLEGEPALVRVDALVDFDWGEGAPDRKVGANIFSVRWTGYIVPPATAEYSFHLTSGDGSRLWIDDELLIDNWRDHGMREKTGRIVLAAGVARRLKIEFYENMLYAGVKLEWSVTGSSRGEGGLAREVVPSRYLFAPEVDFTPPLVATVAAGGGRRHKVGSKVKIVVSERRGEEGLTGVVRIVSESTGYAGEVSNFRSLPDGVYVAEWETAGLTPAEDYAVEIALTDAAGNSDADGLPESPDLVIALEPDGRMLSLADPEGGPPRPGCGAGGAAGAGQIVPVLLSLGLALAARRRLAAAGS